MGWQRAWHDYSTIVTISAILLPLLVAAALLALVRRRDGAHAAVRRSVAEVGLVAGTLPWLAMAFTPQPAPRSVDLVPLHDLPSWFDIDVGTTSAQFLGNLLVLAAFGFFLPIRFALGWTRVVVLAVGCSVAIEALQYALDIGRVSSVDDVLVNTVGAALAAAASRRWWAVRRISEPEMNRIGDPLR